MTPLLLIRHGRTEWNETGRLKDQTLLVQAGERINAAVQQVTPRFAGKTLDRSGYSTTEIGQMVIEAL